MAPLSYLFDVSSLLLPPSSASSAEVERLSWAATAIAPGVDRRAGRHRGGSAEHDRRFVQGAGFYHTRAPLYPRGHGERSPLHFLFSRGQSPPPPQKAVTVQEEDAGTAALTFGCTCGCAILVVLVCL